MNSCNINPYSIRLQTLRYMMSLKHREPLIDQDPEPNDKVKENRTVYITITKTVAPKIKMPNLIDVSYKQAISDH